jgi:isopentenyldiphosphate isomerase
LINYGSGEIMEIWDGYNADGSLAGIDLIRGEVVPKGIYHIVAEILVVHEDGSILVMQRDLRKPNYPGLYEASAGGSILKGETSKNGAFRELQEETGIIAGELEFLSRFVKVNGKSIYDQYICVTDCDKDSVTLQDGETIDYKWLKQEEFFEFINSSEYVSAHRDRLMRDIDRIKEVIESK